jgi:hypothetical protein
MNPNYVYAHCDNVSTRVNGLPITIRRGECRYADDPVVLAHPDLFTDQPLLVTRFPGWEPDVEQATAAPGEKRSTRRAS